MTPQYRGSLEPSSTSAKPTGQNSSPKQNDSSLDFLLRRHALPAKNSSVRPFSLHRNTTFPPDIGKTLFPERIPKSTRSREDKTMRAVWTRMIPPSSKSRARSGASVLLRLDSVGRALWRRWTAAPTPKDTGSYYETFPVRDAPFLQINI